jgi:hypothetical protein
MADDLLRAVNNPPKSLEWHLLRMTWISDPILHRNVVLKLMMKDYVHV